MSNQPTTDMSPLTRFVNAVHALAQAGKQVTRARVSSEFASQLCDALVALYGPGTGMVTFRESGTYLGSLLGVPVWIDADMDAELVMDTA